jgi:hypothetical protein
MINDMGLTHVSKHNLGAYIISDNTTDRLWVSILLTYLGHKLLPNPLSLKTKGIKMKKFTVLVCVIAGLLSGCGKIDRVTSSFTGKPSEVCVDGVSYLQFTSGATVKLDINGKPVPCK